MKELFSQPYVVGSWLINCTKWSLVQTCNHQQVKCDILRPCFLPVLPYWKWPDWKRTPIFLKHETSTSAWNQPNRVKFFVWAKYMFGKSDHRWIQLFMSVFNHNLSVKSASIDRILHRVLYRRAMVKPGFLFIYKRFSWKAGYFYLWICNVWWPYMQSIQSSFIK